MILITYPQRLPPTVYPSLDSSTTTRQSTQFPTKSTPSPVLVVAPWLSWTSSDSSSDSEFNPKFGESLFYQGRDRCRLGHPGVFGTFWRGCLIKFSVRRVNCGWKSNYFAMDDIDIKEEDMNGDGQASLYIPFLWCRKLENDVIHGKIECMHVVLVIKGRIYPG